MYKIRFFYITLIIACLCTKASAQNKASITGTITGENGEVLAGVHIINAKTHQSHTSSVKGTYKLDCEAGQSITILFSHIGYQTLEKNFDLESGQKLEFNPILKEKRENLNEIDIAARQKLKNKGIYLQTKDIDKIASAGGESLENLLKTLPGVSSNNELSSQYSVRGGNFDENLVYINDIEVYRPTLIRSSQQEGLSVINPDLVSSVLFSAGGFDAKYGDKLSSVLDIKYKMPRRFEASADVSLLGSSAHIANVSKNGKLSYLAGFRYKTTRYLLASLDTEGDYNPNYKDLQTLINYSFNQKLSLHFWANISNNKYSFKPKDRETNFGTISDALQLKMYFDGQEKDEYSSDMEALTLKYRHNSRHLFQLIANRYKTVEKERFDIQAQYYLQDLFVSQGGDKNKSLENLGIGTYLDHANNKLDRTVNSLKLKADHNLGDLHLQWGIKALHEKIDDRINEWQYRDSAGYSIPFSNSQNLLAYSRQALNYISGTHMTGYTQGDYKFGNESGDFQLTAGLRYHHWSYNNSSFLSPRFSINYIPNWKRQMKFRLAIGNYQQMPSYRESLKIDGTISSKLNTQEAWHYSLAHEYLFKIKQRDFRLSSELYYKDLKSLIPYDIENVRLRYYGNQKAKGYTAGVEFRLNWEYVPDTESWISLSLMKTRENILGDNRGYIARPSDQRFNFSMFFQDYIPGNPSYKMHLTLIYAGGLPVWVPKIGKQGDSFNMPHYRRADLGFSKELLDTKKVKYKGLLKHFKSMWIGLEIFNLFDINNTVSYLWINDIQGNQYAIPNYLTARKLNLKLSAKF